MISTCEVCEKEFKYYSRQRGRFCSVACYKSTRKKKIVDRICKQCGKVFKYYDRGEIGRGLFCSLACMHASARRPELTDEEKKVLSTQIENNNSAAEKDVIVATDSVQKAIRSHMENNSISESELSRRSGVSRQAINALFNQNSSNLLTLARYARAIGLELTLVLVPILVKDMKE